MNNENFHPVQHEPPLAHALHHWYPEKGLLTYEYNGTNILEITVPVGTDLGFRHGSDGSMQSVHYIQQIYLASEKACKATVKIRLNADCLNMRPHRAQREQAILGTASGLLSYGVNGMYDPVWDLLIDWHGREWKWTNENIVLTDDGYATATLETELCMSAMYINLRLYYYKNHLGYHYHCPWNHRPKQNAVAGWCSWEAFRRDIDINKIESISEFLHENLQSYGLQYLQVDDGFQSMPLPIDAKMTMEQGWMTCIPEKFPEGHPSIVKTIREKDLTPAIWVNPNITNPDFPNYHPNNVIWNGDKPLKGEWIDFLYSCDPQTLSEHVEPLFRKFKELGYQYIKIDGIRHLLYDGLHECVRLGLMTNEEASHRFRAYMESAVKGMGNDVYCLSSWGEMDEIIGLTDACRISMDANPTWAGVRMQLFESARWFHTQRILFLNDPDHVCVRTKAEWAKSILSLISLSGELYMLSDTQEAYTPEKLDIVHKTLPPLTTKTGETGSLNVEYPAYTWTKLHGFAVQSHETPVEMEDVSAEEAANIAGWTQDRDALHPFSSLWSFAMSHHGLNWRVMLRVATTPLSEGQIPLDRLALDPKKTYLAFDFWKQNYLGEVTGSFNCEALNLGCCQVVAFYEKPEVPTVIASDRHVSMDAVSILEHRYENNVLHLKLNGVKNQKFKYMVYLPKGMTAGVVSANGAKLFVTQKELLCLEVSFEQEQAEICIPIQN